MERPGQMPEPRRKSTTPNPEKGPRPIQLTIRAHKEWREWLVGFAGELRITTADVVDHALVDYAKRKGYPKPPPR